MNPEIKARWLEALRSGRYAQTKRTLRDENGFCCLGVLCDVVAPDLGLQWKENLVNGSRFNIANSISLLPTAVMAATGLLHADAVLDSGLSLIELNDNGHSFSEIADIIEKEL